MTARTTPIPRRIQRLRRRLLMRSSRNSEVPFATCRLTSECDGEPAVSLLRDLADLPPVPQLDAPRKPSPMSWREGRRPRTVAESRLEPPVGCDCDHLSR